MRQTKKTLTQALAVVCAGALLFGALNVSTEGVGSSKVATADTESMRQLENGLVDTHMEDYLDSDKVFRLTDEITADTDISVILSLGGDTMLDLYNKSGSDLSFSDFGATPEAMKAKNEVVRCETKLVKKLNRSGLDYTIGETYDTIVNGFEVVIKAGDFDKLAAAAPNATLIVGDEYEECETEVVTNDVDVYDTGIFDSSNSKYSGDGVVVAVLDTGLDYTHTAFSVDNFEHETLAYTKEDVESKVSGLNAASTTADLSANDVYVNEKVPYQYDYADKDTDVFPINSEHGTHVSGIILGNDDEITGVAPSAQLMMMKVFSDTSTGAKDSWILAALEDCIKLGVDVINMSLGSSNGFSREVDKENKNAIYDAIEAEGISMICAAGNDYNSTMGSDKNGSLPLTSNPDSGTVSSPSTYGATMSVASVSGVATNYMLYGDEVIYFNEATDSTATTRSFFDDIIRRYEELYGRAVSDDETLEIPFEVISGLGRNSDYLKNDYTGEIVLVKRGTTTFEEKIRIAMQNKNALGIIIYNNVSGDISMSIGANSDAAACSISQDDGEMLASSGGGYLKIGRGQEAGPFMSDFSSWGPTSDLKIKPEITAHGGDIYSCIPGQGYDRLSGTSMATPNMAGVTALIRQYVRENENNKFHLSEGAESYRTDVAAIVNKVEMSTADILYNKNAIPYSVRKQGAGLVNLYSAQKSDAYISTFDSDGEMDKAKIEFGDDVERKGVYELAFKINNISTSSVEYRVDAVMETEGVSSTYTSHGDTTVTQDGKILEGTTLKILSVDGGSLSGDSVKVSAGGEAVVEVRITLSEDDKDYMTQSFENGMYVEGFITLEQLDGSNSEDFVDLSVPVLGFFGDWTEAPIFDEEYYDTNADEINAGINDEDKLMADAYATRVLGGAVGDSLFYMGVYVFNQDPSAVQMAANKDYIAMSNNTNQYYYNINSLAYVYAGLLRNVKTIDVSITEDATGKTIYTDTVSNQYKSYGTSSVYASAIDMGKFSAYDYNLKNNTRYTMTLEAYIDYDEHEQNNKRNTFSFPLFIDYEAPVLTDVEFRTEYDSVTKKTSLFADLYVYDNHYAQAVQVGCITESSDDDYLFSLNSFGAYLTPVNSSFNSTTLVSVELTDYMDEIKNSQGYDLNYEDGTYTIAENTNSIIVAIYDYALNFAEYEVRLPDSIVSLYFGGEYGSGREVEDIDGKPTITLEVNETLDLTQIMNVYPSTAWVQTFDYVVAGSDQSFVRVVNQTVLALAVTGNKSIEVKVKGYTSSGGSFEESLYVVVQDTGKRYTLPVVNDFSVKSYHVDKAFYSIYSDEREIGLEGYTYEFGSSPSLTMFPSETVAVSCSLQTYFPDDTYIRYTVANSSVATVNEETGKIVAQKEGSTSVTATVYYKDPEKGDTSQRSARISITVKDPFTTNSIYLMSYKGLGDVVEIPDDRGITTIYQFAFSNYEYVDKDVANGDVIDDEDPYYTKATYIGDDTITKVIIPEGVVEIQGYAFANLTALEEVVLPSTLTRIGCGAFYGCTKLTTVSFTDGDTKNNNVQFINDYAFENCTSLEQINLDSVVAIGKRAFMNCDLKTLRLPRTCQSIGEYAFYKNSSLWSVNFLGGLSSSVKLGSYAFAYCTDLQEISVDAPVIPSYAFYNCSKLATVTLGSDVAAINAYAFYGTNVTKFEMSASNTYLEIGGGGTVIYSDGGKVLQAVAQSVSEITLDSKTTTISNGAFAGTRVTRVTGENVTVVKDYAFASCTALTSITLGELEEVGGYAFYNASIKSLPAFANGVEIGEAAFAYCYWLDGTLSIQEGTVLGDRAFYGCTNLKCVTIRDECIVGAYAFYGCTGIERVTIGDDCTVGEYAFEGAFVTDFYTYYNQYYSMYEDLTGYYYWLGYSEYYTEYSCDDYILVNPDNPDDKTDLRKFIYTSSDPNAELNTLFYRMNLSEASTSSLTTVKIGSGTVIGTGAFENCARLTCLTFGETGQEEADIVVGDYAFCNCVGLKSVSFNNVVEIGAYAFAALIETIDVMFPVDLNNSDAVYAYNYTYAYNYEYVNGELSLTGYKYTHHVGNLEGELDLSSVRAVGEGAFAYNPGVTAVILCDSLTEIPAYCFYGCTGLSLVYKSSYVNGVSDEMSSFDDISVVGQYAFAYTALKGVSLQHGMELCEGAFYMCESLSAAENLSDVGYVGSFAFAYTKIGMTGNTLNLSGIEYIGDFAFAYIESDGVMKVDFLGENSEGEGALVEIGENPFLGTRVDFSFDKEETFGGIVVDIATIDTYVINGSAYVSSGVLYATLEKGNDIVSVLVTYPVDKTDVSYTLDEGTVRISAHAFDGNQYVEMVTMSAALLSVGDKAFYDCLNLGVVVFTSYEAPALEEEYDESYYGLISGYPAPYYASGYYPSYGYGYWYEGLGVVDYPMWSLTQNNYFYGATFVDYVGKVEKKLTMIVPVNGLYYDSFILAHYFDTVIYGAAAPTADTLYVIALIDTLPSTITLDWADTIYEALDAYNMLSLEQQALVTNYSKLSSSLGQLEFLESLQASEDEEEPSASEEKSSSGFMRDNMWGLIIALVILLAFVALLVYTLLTRKKPAAETLDGADGVDGLGDAPVEDASPDEGGKAEE